MLCKRFITCRDLKNAIKDVPVDALCQPFGTACALYYNKEENKVEIWDRETLRIVGKDAVKFDTAGKLAHALAFIPDSAWCLPFDTECFVFYKEDDRELVIMDASVVDLIEMVKGERAS